MAADSEDKLVQREKLEPEVAEAGLEGDWPPKWMTTYTDLTTLLMTFFVLWYALTMMKIPAELWKFRETKEETLEHQGSEEFYQGQQNLLEDTLVWQKIEAMAPEEKMAMSEVKTLKDQVFDIRKTLEQGEIKDGVKMKVVGEDMVIIPAARLLFSEGSSTIKSSFYPVLDKIAALLKKQQAYIRIEGHTDNIPIHPRHRRRYPTNYELSAARAISVARYFIDRYHISPERIAVAGYGSLLPQYSNQDPEKKEMNRRVEFHISISSEIKPKKS